MTMAVMLGACGDADAKRTASTAPAQTVNDLIEKAAEQVASTEEASVASVEEETEVSLDTVAQEAADVDVDLTKLSKTMVYSEVYNIMVNPDDYIGKTIRMGGAYNIFVDETTGMTYYYCVIQDATACCAQGIEFILTDDYKYPDDYPDEGENITVVGNFDTYMEGEYLYCTLRDAVLEN